MRAVRREKKIPGIIEVSLPPESRAKDPVVGKERVEKGTLPFEQVPAVNGDKVVRFEVDKRGSYESRGWQQKEDGVVNKIMDAEVTVSTRELLKLPSVREALERSWGKTPAKWPSARVFGQGGGSQQGEGIVHRVNVDELPGPKYHIARDEEEGVPVGAVVHEDCVATYLDQLPPGDKPIMVYVARDLQVLRSLYPMVNEQAKVETILDSGSQIVCMSLEKALVLGLTWDPDIQLCMESTNQQVN